MRRLYVAVAGSVLLSALAASAQTSITTASIVVELREHRAADALRDSEAALRFQPQDARLWILKGIAANSSTSQWWRLLLSRVRFALRQRLCPPWKADQRLRFGSSFHRKRSSACGVAGEHIVRTINRHSTIGTQLARLTCARLHAERMTAEAHLSSIERISGSTFTTDLVICRQALPSSEMTVRSREHLFRDARVSRTMYPRDSLARKRHGCKLTSIAAGIPDRTRPRKGSSPAQSRIAVCRQQTCRCIP